MAGREHAYRQRQIKMPFPRRKIEQRHARRGSSAIRPNAGLYSRQNLFRIFHTRAQGSLSAFTGGLMEEAGRV
jgi:hypothetical protein